MSNTTLTQRITQLETELTAVNAAISTALGEPSQVAIQGSASWTNRSLPELYAARDMIERRLALLRVGGVIRTTPYYDGTSSVQ